MISSPASPPRGPLSHLRVVDLTDLRGALAGRILADLGADVVKVEPPGGDADRLRPPFAGDVAAPDRSLPFLFRHANKRGVVLDVHAEAVPPRLVELCERADVLVENLAPAEPLRHWLASEEARERLPHLVHVTISDFGLSGPRADWRLEPLPAFAASGALLASGFPDRPPCWLPGHVAHDCAAIAATVGALAAIGARVRHGLGDRVEVSVQEAACAGLDPWAVALADYARVYPVLPTSLPRDAEGPALVLPTEDGFVRILAVTPRHWRAFAAVLANRDTPAVHAPDDVLAAHPGAGAVGLVRGGLSAMLDEAASVARRALLGASHLPLPGSFLGVYHGALRALRRLGSELLQGRARADVLAHARRVGLPITPVNSLEEFVAEEQTRVRGTFLRTGFPHLGDAPFAPFPCRLERTPATLRRAAPAPGDDDRAGFPPAAPPAQSPGAAGPPLDGVRVVTFGVGAVVPGLCRTLAELGAEVIKIESHGSPDFLRRLTFEPESPNRSWPFNDENRGQASVCLDLKTPRGRELALALCARADVVAENRQGGALRRLGLAYEDVRRVRPDVIHLSSQGFGEGGPLAEAPAFGQLNAAFCGIAFLWNPPDAPYPAGSALEHPDHVAGQLAAVAVLAALEHRRRTHEGQRIELAQTEAAAFLHGELYLQRACTGRPVVPCGNAVDYACPHGVYPAAGTDRWIALAVVGDDAWERFRARLRWGRDPVLATLPGRLSARAGIDARVAEWTRRRNAERMAEALQAIGVSAMPVQGPEDHRRDPHLRARGALVTLDDPEIGPVQHIANPIRLTRAPLVTAGPAPRLGGDTGAVLARWLGLDRREIERLIGAGVCA